MTLQASGAISLANIQTEFGGSNPIGINEYYGVAAGVPASGTISLANFYGKSAAPVNNWNWNTYYQMGDRNVTGTQTTEDSYNGNIVTPGAANSPVTFLITTTPSGSGYGGVFLYLYIDGSLASTYSGNNPSLSRFTSFGSSSLQFRSYLNTGLYTGYTVSAIVRIANSAYLGGPDVITYRHVTDYQQVGGGDD